MTHIVEITHLTNKKVKLVNKILKELLHELNVFYNKEYNYTDVRFNSIKQLSEFHTQILDNLTSFMNCDLEIFNNVLLFKNLQLLDIDLGKNKFSVWKYLHNMFLITWTDNTVIKKDDASDEVITKEYLINLSKNNITELYKNENIKPVSDGNLGNNLSGLFNLFNNPDMIKMVQCVAEQISSSSVSDGNIPMNLMSQLMGGNGGKGNEQFMNIIQETTSIIKKKVDDGELNLSNLNM